jgi:RNA polymerase sigma-54 factor
MRSSLELRASQQLALTPQIVQAIRLLQMSAADLEHEIEESLAKNPFLERLDRAQTATEPRNDRAPGSGGEEILLGDMAGVTPQANGGEDEAPAAVEPWSGTARQPYDGERDYAESWAARVCLRDHLREQLAGSRLEALDRLLVETVIDGLDDDGYLRQSTDELLQTLPPEVGATAEDTEVAVHYVQSLDPAGVGARSLSECLALQLGRLADDEEVDSQTRTLALAIVRRHLDLLALHDAQQLAQELRCEHDDVHRANLLIRRLDPRPGAAFGESDTRYVVADVVVRKVGGKWTATINPQAVPNIRVNRMYAEALQASRGAPGALAQHLQEARRLVRNVQQRFDTIQRVAQVIVDRQRLYFELGELAIRPLVLRDVARELGLHPSTVSRVSSNKYAQTPTGVVELKRFFSTRASHREGGATCSSAAIRALIRELITAESPADPLSDVQITRLLASRGISVARRTVAKYRSALRIAAVESRRMTVDTPAPHRSVSARPIAALASERRAAQRLALAGVGAGAE